MSACKSAKRRTAGSTGADAACSAAAALMAEKSAASLPSDVAAVGAGALPVHAAAALGLAMPAAKKLMDFAAETHDDPSRVFRAKFFAVRWHAALGMLLTIAFTVARVVR